MRFPKNICWGAGNIGKGVYHLHIDEVHSKELIWCVKRRLEQVLLRPCTPSVLLFALNFAFLAAPRYHHEDVISRLCRESRAVQYPCVDSVCPN